jgi:hypothetical protein
MLSLQERYAQAIRSGNLTSDPNTTFSDADVLGAMAFADKRLGGRRMGAGAVSRYLAGDTGGASNLVELLSDRLHAEAEKAGSTLPDVEAKDIVRGCLAWLVYGKCEKCNGTRYVLLGHHVVCPVCLGSGKRSFVNGFRSRHLEIAKWLVSEIAADVGVCGAEALRSIAPRVVETS